MNNIYLQQNNFFPQAQPQVMPNSQSMLNAMGAGRLLGRLEAFMQPSQTLQQLQTGFGIASGMLDPSTIAQSFQNGTMAPAGFMPPPPWNNCGCAGTYAQPRTFDFGASANQNPFSMDALFNRFQGSMFEASMSQMMATNPMARQTLEMMLGGTIVPDGMNDGRITVQPFSPGFQPAGGPQNMAANYARDALNQIFAGANGANGNSFFGNPVGQQQQQEPFSLASEAFNQMMGNALGGIFQALNGGAPGQPGAPAPMNATMMGGAPAGATAPLVNAAPGGQAAGTQPVQVGTTATGRPVVAANNPTGQAGTAGQPNATNANPVVNNPGVPTGATSDMPQPTGATAGGSGIPGTGRNPSPGIENSFFGGVPAPADGGASSILGAGNLSVEDALILLLFLILQQLDKEIANQVRVVEGLQNQNAGNAQAAGNSSIDMETMALSRMTEKRGNMFDTINNIMDNYDATAKSGASSIRDA